MNNEMITILNVIVWLAVLVNLWQLRKESRSRNTTTTFEIEQMTFEFPDRPEADFSRYSHAQDHTEAWH